MTLRHLIVDRDGVLNEELEEGWVSRWTQWRWLPGVLEALSALRQAGVRVSVVTNQSGIGRGLVSASDVDEIHRRMQRDVLASGGQIDAVLVCPHAPEQGCNCRKPRPDLILRAMSEGGAPASQTVLVGDDARDLEAGRTAGVRVALVRTGKGARVAPSVPAGVPVFDDFGGAVALLLEGEARASASALDVRSLISSKFANHERLVRSTLANVAPQLASVIDAAIACLCGGHRVFACGNGGSAADAQHFAAELVQGVTGCGATLPALALTTNTSVVTAVANDSGFDAVFARQIEALGTRGDMLMALSSSGQSPNVLLAVVAAKKRGLVTVGFTGLGGGSLGALVDHLVAVPSTEVPRVQEMHGLCLHILAEIVESAFARGEDGAR
jgi:D-sedoheptulose 7-phosphate isomerase